LNAPWLWWTPVKRIRHPNILTSRL
jgi:hypothetical protein